MLGTELATKKQEPVQLKSIFLPISHLKSKHKLEESKLTKGRACSNIAIKYVGIWNVPATMLTGDKSLLSCFVLSKLSREPVNINQTSDRLGVLGLIDKSWHTVTAIWSGTSSYPTPNQGVSIFMWTMSYAIKYHFYFMVTEGEIISFPPFKYYI